MSAREIKKKTSGMLKFHNNVYQILRKIIDFISVTEHIMLESSNRRVVLISARCLGVLIDTLDGNPANRVAGHPNPVTG